MTMWPNKIAAHNAGWRLQFRFADYVLWSGMCELTSEVIRQRVF
jgi:hypothetical protein